MHIQSQSAAGGEQSAALGIVGGENNGTGVGKTAIYRYNKLKQLDWSVNGVYKGHKEVDQLAFHIDQGKPTEVKSDFVEYVPESGGYYKNIASEQVFPAVELPPGETTKITMWVEMRNSSNPTAHNVFAIDVPQSMLENKPGKDYTLYKNTLQDVWQTILYDQN